MITLGAVDREVALLVGGLGGVWEPRLMSTVRQGDIFFPFPERGPIPADSQMWALALADAHQEPDPLVGDVVWSVRARWGIL